MPTLVNIGCGTVIHPAWINLDLEPRLPGVRSWDLRRGLPLPDGTVDACYSSHVLEHLRPAEVDRLLREQFRVLRPGGRLRVVVPDLALICRHYLVELAAAEAGGPGAVIRHEDSRLVLIDQLVRERGGGGLAAFWRTVATDPAARAYLERRHGREVAAVVDPVPPVTARLTGGWRTVVRRWRRRLTALAVRLIGGRDELAALQEGRFRQSGEVHRTMFDHVGLERLLARHGFIEIKRHTALTSAIPDFDRFGLDAVAGVPGKPDSLYLEACRPGAGPAPLAACAASPCGINAPADQSKEIPHAS
jgi:SAM-dependent methyltransferase